MPLTPITGKDATVTFTKTGGTAVTLKNSHVTINDGPNIFEAHNTSDGILRGRGLDDASGTVDGFVVEEQLISDVVHGGDVGLLQINLSPTKFYSCTAILGQIAVDSGGINEPEKWSFPWSLQSGILTRPV